MKKLLVIALFFVPLIIACEKANEITEVPVTGRHFERANSIKFYFSNDENQDLLNLKNNTILPVAFESTIPNFPSEPGINDTIVYLYDGGSIRYNYDLERYYWNTFVYGRQGYEEHEFYVKITESDIDTMKILYSFKFIENEVYINIDEWYYNNTLIVQEKPVIIDRYTNENIFIKKENNNTIISF